MSIVYTIGYEGTDIDRLVATLKAVDVSVLADVRAVAVSRKKGFSKTALRARLEDEGITYLHFVGLGDPKPGREAARAGRFDEFRQIYSRHLASADAQTALLSLSKIAQNQAVCLLCFERDPRHCHRSIVADLLEGGRLSSFDLYGDLPRRYDNYTTK
ncbi:MAG: DUF488 domain-containing protein, partial [Methylocystis sp.]|nr:DUF488 domain-containing protein [Methylocystis sp.]